MSIGALATFAAPLCTSFVGLTAATLQSLGSTGCQFGDKVFYNFTYDYTLEDSLGHAFAGDANTPMVGASSAMVQFTNLGGDPLQPVLSLVGTWQVADGNSGDIALHYQVSAPSSAAMHVSWVAAYGSLTNTDPLNDFAPYIAIAEAICCPGGSAVGLGLEIDAPAGVSPLTPGSAYDEAAYTASTMIQISKDVFLSSGSGRNVAILNRVDQGINESSPEPMSALLLGGGLIGLSLLGKRRNKAAKK
jgi:hypothetical protein